mgnify:CR=1 FL=1
MDFKQQKAIYMQIADYILDNILAEQLQTGDRVQSVREMASNVQVNPNTVVRTYSYLQDKGIIFNQRGIGYFVADDAYEKTRQLKKESFTNHYLPEVFKLMRLLQIDFEDLREIYQKNQNDEK